MNKRTTEYPAKWMAAGALFTDRQGRVLVVKPTYKDGWEIPGGMIEENESPAHACTREIREELGFGFVPGKLLCVDYLSNSDGRGDRIMFIFDGGEIGERTISLLQDELSEYRFIDLEEVSNLFHERLAKRIPKAREAQIKGISIYLENGTPLSGIIRTMHPAEQPDELLQCFDDQGNPTEFHTRAEVKQLPPRWWYAVSRIWLVNDQGQLMCSKRAGGLSGNPGKWQTYFGGHVGAGLTIKEVAKRELEEEAGVSLPLAAFHLIDKGRVEEKKVFFESYAVRFNGQPADLQFLDNEVTEAKWMGMDEYWQEKENHPDEWCNGCSLENQERIREWLRKS